MKVLLLFVFAFKFGCARRATVSQSRSASTVTPVQKVIELLEGMVTKGKAEKHAEVVQFGAYKKFCEDTTIDKQRAVDEANVRIELLKSDIEKHLMHATKLGKEIAAHDADIAAWNDDIAAATKVHQMEKADYDTLHKDYSESIDALCRAIDVLKKQAFNRDQASLAQLSTVRELNLVPHGVKQAITAFLAQDPNYLDYRAPEAYGYEFQSRSVIDMLEKLQDKFIAKRTDLEMEEKERMNAFEMLTQELQFGIKTSTEDRTEKAGLKAEALQKKADCEGNLVDVTTTRDADQKYLEDLTATCEQKATDFETRQQLRDDELEAIRQAIEILAGNAVAGNSEKYLPQLVQTSASLAMLRTDQQNQAQSRAAKYLQARAQELGSRPLSLVALRVAKDPFAKVKKMIKDLILRLMEEATAEVEHKGWCDTELSTNEQTRTQKTMTVEMLHAEIDELEASIAKLAEDITELSKAVAELDAAMAEATQFRKAEKATNEKTIVDAQEAQTAVAQAILVLQEFYSKASASTALLQQQPTPPPIFDKPYTGMQAEKGGVVSMLEVIESDFARLEADTMTAEAVAKKEYDQFMEESKVDKAQKVQAIEHKTAKKEDQSQALASKKSEVEATQKELNAALDYFDKLKPSCVDAGTSYEQRVARRQEEIQSLQEALRILNGEDIVTEK